MAGIKTIPNNATLDTTEDQFQHLLVRLRRNPHTKPLIPEAETFRAKIDAIRAQERTLIEADAEGTAAVQFADQELDASVDLVGDNTDRKSLIGGRLFGDLRPSELKRPLLGGQLEVMTAWPDILSQSDKEVLKAHASLVAKRVEVARTAADEKKAASNKLADFRSVGARVKLNEEHNAFRKAIYGKLGEIQHASNLPSGWAESFFQQDSPDNLSLTELDRKIGTAEGDLDSLKKQRESLKAQEAKIAAVRAEAVRREKKAKLEALTKAKAELEAKENALREELEEDENGKQT